MTRETKIGLLVGLAFIIVIGILLSEQLSRSTDVASAPISVVGQEVRNTVTPPAAVPTNADIKPAPAPVVVLKAQPANGAAVSPASPAAPNAPVAQPGQPGSTDPRIAAGGGEIVALPQHSASGHAYVAQSGDTLSRIAARQMGANTPANRKAIIAANPSLQDDPDMISAGKTYMIPGGTIASAAAPASGHASVSGAVSSQQVHMYTVKQGDTLWRIAAQQTGSSASVAAIEDLNKDVLKGSTNLRLGMQLRLPAKSVAVAN